jgi:hypothetical protein
MMEEKKKSFEDQELEKMITCYKLVNSRLEDMVETGVSASKRSYFQGKLEIYKRMLGNLTQVEEGVEGFFMGSLWKDILHSKCMLKKEEELLSNSRRSGETGLMQSKEASEVIESKFTLNFLKKRARVEGDEGEELTKIEMLPGAILKPVKKTQ